MGGCNLGKWALLSQGALVHVLEEFLQGIPYCGVTPLLGWQVLQFGTAEQKVNQKHSLKEDFMDLVLQYRSRGVDI